MKIKGETTIPTGRQFENVKTCYEFESEDPKQIEKQRKIIKQKLKDDCLELHHCLRDEYKDTKFGDPFWMADGEGKKTMYRLKKNGKYEQSVDGGVNWT